MKEGLARGSFTKRHTEIYKDVMRSADHVDFFKAWNHAVTSRPSSSFGIPNNHVIAAGDLSREELQAMQADPKYQNEAGHKKIMEGYRKLEAQGQLVQ